MTDIQCEFGCECDTIEEYTTFQSVLDQKDFQRLIREKVDRARRYKEAIHTINSQIETD